jgi:glycosyltransferase involved in cell wall biosynthesis
VETIVCLPVYNEELSIRTMIEQIHAIKYPVVISDGGSADKSLEIAQKMDVKILSRPGKPKGFGMLKTIEYAHAKGTSFLVFIDCDQSYPVAKIPALINALIEQELDMAVGNRKREAMTIKSKILNKLLPWIIKSLFGGDLKDPASGFRAIRVDSYYGKLKEEGMDLEIELTGFSLRKNLKVKEIDVDYYARVGESKLRLTDILQALFTIFRVRFRQYT